jgi:hypothetical protein
MQANWIGRSEGVDISFPSPRHARSWSGDGASEGLHHPRRHLLGATYCAWPRSIRSRCAAARRNRQLRPSSTSASAAARWRPTSPRRRRKACPPACMCAIRSPAPSSVWVANYVLMGYGEGAVMAVPAHDERDFEFARSTAADPTVIAPRRRVRRPAPWQDAYAEHGITVNSGEFDGLEFSRRWTRSPRRWRRRASARSACSSACATGAFRASATGAARSRSSIARPAATCRCPTRSCPWCCPRIWCRTAAAIRSARRLVLAVQCARSAAAGAARDRHHGHLRGLVLVFPALRLQPTAPGDGRRSGELLAAGGPVHRRHRARHPASAVFALLDAGDARSRAGEVSTSPSPTCSRRAWC